MLAVVFEVIQKIGFLCTLVQLILYCYHSCCLIFVLLLQLIVCDVGLKYATCECTVSCLSNLTILSLMIADF